MPSVKAPPVEAENAEPSSVRETESVETVVVGGGQAGLSVGYHLARRGAPFVILDANERIGDSWRNRWDSLRRSPPPATNGLAEMPFPAPAHSFPSKNRVLRFLFHRVLTTSTPLGRKVRPKLISHGHALIRVKPDHLSSARVKRVAPTVGVKDGLPVLADGRVLDAANVIWCTGFDPDFSWIDLPIFSEKEPHAERGVVADVPGLYFGGLLFLYAASSTMIHGVGRDAKHVAELIPSRRRPPGQPEGGRGRRTP